VTALNAWGDFYAQHNQGWHWYEPLPEPEKAPQKSTTEQSKAPTVGTATKQVEAFKKELETRLHKAWLNPTPANIYAYQVIQKEMTDRARQFSHIWMQNVLTKPELDHTLTSPVNQMARHVYYDAETKRIHSTIQGLAASYGLFFFMSGSCAYCERFAPIVKQFVQTYGWKVLAITVDGATLEEFPQALPDEGLMTQWNVRVLPSLFAVNPTTGHVIPVAFGLTSIDEIEQRIMTLITEKPQ
jgi:conjugal transfer pilus assembly protein TraF